MPTWGYSTQYESDTPLPKKSSAVFYCGLFLWISLIQSTPAAIERNKSSINYLTPTCTRETEFRTEQKAAVLETLSAGFEKKRVTWDANGWSADNTLLGLTGGSAQKWDCYYASAHLKNNICYENALTRDIQGPCQKAWRYDVSPGMGGEAAGSSVLWNIITTFEGFTLFKAIMAVQMFSVVCNPGRRWSIKQREPMYVCKLG